MTPQSLTPHSPIPTGFKQSEVGLIPEDWEVKQLGDILKIEHGKSQHDVVDENGNYPILASGGKIGNATNFIYDKPSVLIGRKGTIDRPQYIETPFWTIDTLFYSIIYEKNDPKFIFYKFSLINWRKHNEASGVPSLNARIIENIQIALPPTLEEQKAIAAALSDIDELIESLEELINKKRQIKQGTMQELLTGKRRLKGFEIKPGYKQTEVGLIPEDWEVKQLGDILKIEHGKSQHDVVDENGNYPILASGGKIGNATNFIYDKPSVLIGRKGTIDRPQYIETPFWTIDTLFYSIIYEKNDPKFIFYKFCLINWRKHNEASGVPSLNARTIENIQIALPPTIEEQKAIAEILTDMDEEIQGLEERLKKTREIKQGMMQELLTGRIRLI